MKTVKCVWEKFVSIENLQEAIYNACRGHKNKEEVEKALADVPGLAKTIHDLLVSGEFEFNKPKPKTITERGKERTIVRPKFFYDHIVHHAIVQALWDGLFKDGMHGCSCGSIPGRGTSYAIRRMKKAMLARSPKYYLQMDIKHFFESVKAGPMLEALSRKIKDHKMLNLLRKLLESVDGLPLGYYTSQWFANFLLTPIDHFVTGKKRIWHYTRYMDDMVVFGRNKKELFKLREEIQRMLEGLGLTLKPSWHLHLFCRSNGMALNFLGHSFKGNFKDAWATLRAPLFLRLRRKFTRLEGKAREKPISSSEASAAMSYHGWLKTSNTRTFLNKIKDFAKFMNVLKRVAGGKRPEEGLEESVNGKKVLSAN